MSETSQNYDAWVEEELKKNKNAKKTDFYPDKDLATRKKEAKIETPPENGNGKKKSLKEKIVGTQKNPTKLGKAGQIADQGLKVANALEKAFPPMSGYKGVNTTVKDNSKNTQSAKGDIAYSGKQSTSVRELDDDAKDIMRQIRNLDKNTYG